MRTSFFRVVTITAVFIGLSTAVQSQVKNYSDLEEQIEQFRVDWDVPGLSVAIVQNGEIVFNRGFGELEKGKGEQPDGQSLTFSFFELRSEEHTSELQSRENLVCRLLLEKKKNTICTSQKRQRIDRERTIPSQ